MTFNELRNSFPVHILDKNEMHYIQGKVINKGNPRPNTQVPAPNQTNLFQLPQLQTVVDVTIEADGKTSTYVADSNASAVMAGNILIALDKQDIIRELKAINAECDEYLANVGKKKEAKDKCTKLIGELDTDFKEKQAMETEIQNLKNAQKEQGDKLDKILKLLQHEE